MRADHELSVGSVTAVDRRRVEAQGFLGLDDRQIGQIKYWLRLSPAICMTWTACGTVLQSAPVLWALAPFALLGALLPGHPFDLLYTFGIRRLTGGAALPGHGHIALRVSPEKGAFAGASASTRRLFRRPGKARGRPSPCRRAGADVSPEG